MEDSPEVRPHGFRAPRRVASAPVTPRPRTAETSPGGEPVETLYYHPNVKVISFTSSGKALLQNADAAREEAGTLSAGSPVERTIAVGPLRIYRAPGSVAFLSCGSALQPILLKSQCWCINEENTVFVLQIRRPNYWRIELQQAWDSDDRDKPEALREVMGMILQFEKTYCPFQRSFTVEVEEPMTPTIKKAWTPKHTPNSGPMLGMTPEMGSPASPQIARTLFEASGRHGRRHSQHISGLGLRSMPFDDGILSLGGSRRSSNTDDLLGGEGSTAHESLVSGINGEPLPKLEESPMVPRIVEDIQSRSGIDGVPITPFTDNGAATLWSKSLSVTEPTQGGSPIVIAPGEAHAPAVRHVADYVKPLERVLSAPLFPTNTTTHSPPWEVPETILENGDDAGVGLDDNEPSGRVSPSPSQESFHSVASWESVDNSIPISIPNSDGHSLGTATGLCSSTALEIRQSLVRRRAKRDSESSDSEISIDGKEHTPRLAQSNNAGRYQSAIGMNILQQARNLPLVIIAKTCEILLGPPTYLLNLMLRIASRIIAGEWKGLIFGYDEDGEQIPVHWDLSDDDDEQID